ncbi:tax1-binding protein 1 homolog B-like, partial [Plectropomus leopardus]|uniref:tax1-binding protein 1 homolog B-like n=1 Tax=Plectropomus leopardus TaxID=160734 RepID=UPI001C4AD18E
FRVQVGWSTTKDYHTFVWVEPSVDVVGQDATGQVVFKEYYLPKDEIEFYQFCYVDSTGQVRGASTPFCFKNPVEQSMESSPDDDLLVITTQEQVEQSVREKAELQKELNQMKEENETLKNDLQKNQQEAASLKGQNEQKEKEMSQLVKEMDQIKEQNENLKSTLQQQQKETDNLKEELLTQKTKQMDLQQHEQKQRSQSLRLEGESAQNEKYDRAVMKINLLKEEREELKGKVDAQSSEIAKLNSKLREQERELLKTKDSIQLLQVDLQSSEKEKERLSAELQKLQSIAHNVDDVKRENQELCRRLSQQETVQNCPDDDLKVRCQTLVSQLHEAQAKLAAEREDAKTTKNQTEYLERHLQQARDQLERVISACEEAERKSGKLELLLREAHEAIADKDGVIEEKDRMMLLMTHEREELTREVESLTKDIEGLRRICDELQAASPVDSPHIQPESTSPAATQNQQQQDAPEQAESLYES